MSSFEREFYCVEQLATLLGMPIELNSRSPLELYQREIGVDVIGMVGGKRVGVQVTEYDGGEGVPAVSAGRMRAEEKVLIKAARPTGVYVGWGSSHFETAFPFRIAAKVQKALNFSFEELDKVWLLVSANIPGVGISTSVPFAHIDSDQLNELTEQHLDGTRYDRVFFHLIMGDILFGWGRLTGWQKLIDRHADRGRYANQSP